MSFQIRRTPHGRPTRPDAIRHLGLRARRLTLVGVLLGVLCAGLAPSPALRWAHADEAVPVQPGRILEFLPLYKYKDVPQDAVHALYATLADLAITAEDVSITVLALAPDKLAVSGTQDHINIVKQLLTNMDPPPRPAPATQGKDLFQEIKVTYLAPEELWHEMDKVMFNFLDFKRFDPGLPNMVVYAKGDGSDSKLTFYIPNPEQVAQQYTTRTQGYTGYTVHLRATEREQGIIDTIRGILRTLDQPLQQKRYEVLEVHYLEIEETLRSLRSAGYNAVSTSADKLTPEILLAIQGGASPVIYSAPGVQQDTAEVSTNLSGTGSGVQRSQFKVLTFDKPVAGSDVNRLIVYGSTEEINGVRAYVNLIDVPAKQMVIEAQIVEINVDNLSDLGLRSIQGSDDILSGSIIPTFPGESGSLSSTNAANFFTYDDAAMPAGSFQAQLAALILQGKATIKARPKVVTVDGRQAIISIVRQVPVAQETLNANNDRSTFDINYIPVGITLNIKPRVGENNSEVQMQVNAVVSNVETINNVVSGLNLQAPELNTREVSTFARVPNHKALVLGGLISTETEERTFKTPILGDLPLIGGLFRRTKKDKDRTEIMIIITPHIVEESGGRTSSGASGFVADDLRTLPKGSRVFDELESTLGQANYLIKLQDIKGIDPSTRQPLSYESEDPPLGSIDDPVFLTLAGIVRKLDLATKLDIVKGIEFPLDWPGPRTAFEARRLAESFLIGYIIEENNLHIPDLVAGREILIPTSGIDPDPDLGFTSEEWHKLNLMAMSQGGLYYRILESLRALDYAAETATKGVKP